MSSVTSKLNSAVDDIIKNIASFERDYISLENINNNDIPDAALQRAKIRAKSIIKLSNHIEELKRQIITHEKLPVIKSNDNNLSRYNESILPSIDNYRRFLHPDIWEFIGSLELDSITNHEHTILKDKTNELLNELLQNIESEDEIYLPDTWMDHEEEIHEVSKITSSGLFEPDRWGENINDLKLIEVNKPEQLTQHIRTRLNEVYKCYIYGNWFSCISTARALMEYAILDRASSLNIKAYDENTGKTRNLVDLIDAVDDTQEELKKHMHKIRGYGNESMHPKINKKTSYMVFEKPQASDCMKSLHFVLFALYKGRQK